MNKAKQRTKSPCTALSDKTRSANPKRSKPGHSAKSAKPVPQARAGTKQAILIDLMSRPVGATLADLVKATGWQPHSVRGAISGALKKKLGLSVTSESIEKRGRVYRIAGQS